MTVLAILKRKGSDVVTIEPTADLRQAVHSLADNRIGALVVTGTQERVIGILSERDIVRAIAEHQERAFALSVAEVMTRAVVTCAKTETVSDIMERMTAGKFRHVPVVEQDRLVGIISIGDVVKSRLEEMASEAEALRDYIRTA